MVNLKSWKAAAFLVRKTWDLPEMVAQRSEVAGLAATISFAQDDLKSLKKFSKELPDGKFETSWWAAILSVQSREYTTARQHIGRARHLLTASLQTKLQEDYSAAYAHAVEAQMLSELEEVLQAAASSHISLETLNEVWKDR